MFISKPSVGNKGRTASCNVQLKLKLLGVVTMPVCNFHVLYVKVYVKLSMLKFTLISFEKKI